MKPEDDAKWPRCLEHDERHWCDSARGFLLDAGDAGTIEAGLRYSVPIVPAYGLFATVAIDSELINDMSAMMYLVVDEDSDPWALPGESLEPIGMWTFGMGRAIISGIIKNGWMIAQGIETFICKSNCHGFAQQVQLNEGLKSGDPMYVEANNWCYAYHKLCLPCLLTKQVTSDPFTPSFDPADYGIPSGGGNGNSTGGQTGAQQRAREALQQRFGNRETSVSMPVSGDNSWPGGTF